MIRKCLYLVKNVLKRNQKLIILKIFNFLSVTNWMCVTLQKVGKSFFSGDIFHQIVLKFSFQGFWTITRCVKTSKAD